MSTQEQATSSLKWLIFWLTILVGSFLYISLSGTVNNPISKDMFNLITSGI